VEKSKNRASGGRRRGQGVYTYRQLPTTVTIQLSFVCVFKDYNLVLKVLKVGKGVKGSVRGCVHGKG